MLWEIRSIHIRNVTLGNSFPISGPVSPSSEQRSLPAQMIHGSLSLWLTACKLAWSRLGSPSIYLIFLFIFGSLFLRLLELPALPALEASLFTLMCCEHDPSLLIKQSSLIAARGGEYNFRTSCLHWGGLGCPDKNAYPVWAPPDLQSQVGVRTLLLVWEALTCFISFPRLWNLYPPEAANWQPIDMFLGSHLVLIIKMFNIKIRTFCQEYGFLPSLKKSVLATLGPPSWVAPSTGTEWWLPLSDGREFLALPQSLPLLITLPL